MVMLKAYQLLMVIILASIFGLMLLAIARQLLVHSTAHAMLHLELILHHLLMTTTTSTVSQALSLHLVFYGITLMIHCGMVLVA